MDGGTFPFNPSRKALLDRLLAEMATWETFGAALAVVASIVSNLGVNIQKFSHAREAARPADRQRAYVQRPVWWLGLSLVVLGSIGDFAAFGFATQSLVAALGGGSTLIANVVTAHFLNGEHLFLVGSRSGFCKRYAGIGADDPVTWYADRRRRRAVRHPRSRHDRVHRRAQRGLPAARAREALRPDR